MTDIKDALAALSEAAEPENLRSMAIVLRQCKVTFGGVEQTSLGKRAATALDQLATAIEAIRTGQLVPVPSVERVAANLTTQMEAQDETTPSSIQRDKGLVWLEGWFDLTAVIAAMKEKPE